MRPGTLYVCATPIGNLGDGTFRLLEVLRQAGHILAEDTRRTRRLLAAYGLRGRIVSCHEHNEERRASQVVRWLAQGEVVALLTDAGTPGVADPGARLVGRVAGEGWPVVPVPGPSAALAALSVAGIPASRTLIEGFLPRDRARRRRRMALWTSWDGAVILFEAPHRLQAVLQDLLEVLPDAYLVVARELTKRHEEILRGRVAELVPELLAREPRGEYTLVLAPPPIVPWIKAAPGAAGREGPRSGNVPPAESPGRVVGTPVSPGPPVDAPEPAPAAASGPVGLPPGAPDPGAAAVPAPDGSTSAPVPDPPPAASGAGFASPPDARQLAAEVAERVAAGLPPSAAVREVARGHGLARSQVYRAYLKAFGQR